MLPFIKFSHVRHILCFAGLVSMRQSAGMGRHRTHLGGHVDKVVHSNTGLPLDAALVAHDLPLLLALLL